MNKPLSKTAALAAANKAHVGQPIRSGYGWVVIGPWRHDDLSGPDTEHRFNDIHAARAFRAQEVATIALILMGRDKIDAAEAVDSAARRGPSSARDLLDSALRTEIR